MRVSPIRPLMCQSLKVLLISSPVRLNQLISLDSSVRHGDSRNLLTNAGSGVNTWKWENGEGKAVLVKYHWEPMQGTRKLTQGEAKDQGKTWSCYTRLYEAIERGIPRMGAPSADHGG